MPSEVNDDHVALICSVLHQHRVAFVVIGGVAARLHETGHSTIDVDICPSRTNENLRRLSLALADLDARLRIEGVQEGLAFDVHPDALAKVTTLTLVTRAGPLDGQRWRPSSSPTTSVSFGGRLVSIKPNWPTGWA